MSDLIERLRTEANQTWSTNGALMWSDKMRDLLLDAATRIEALEQENTRLRDIETKAKAAADALDGEIEQHEAFWLQSRSHGAAGAEEWDAIHELGIKAAKRDLAEIRSALTPKAEVAP